MSDVAFYALAAIALLSGWRVFRTDSMVRASFLLLLSFVSVGLILLLLGAPYLGTATIFMMAVEMMVMALFMVMFMMNPAGLNPMRMVHQQRFAVAAGLGTFAGMAALILSSDFPHAPLAPDRAVVRDLGSLLMGDAMLTFESVGVTLLATMIGSVVLSARSGRYGPSDEGSLPPGLTPGGPPAGRQPEKSTHGHGHGSMQGSMPMGDMHSQPDMRDTHDMQPQPKHDMHDDHGAHGP